MSESKRDSKVEVSYAHSYPQRRTGYKGTRLGGGEPTLTPLWSKPSLQLFKEEGETRPNWQPLEGLE